MSDQGRPSIADAPPVAPAFTCGLDATLKIISGKWKPLILYFLLRGPTRYGELKRAVRDVSDKVLIQHLKELGSGLIGHSQKMTVAASATAEKKTVGQRS